MAGATGNRFMIHIGQGEDRETYECDFNKMLNVEFIAIEQKTGLTVQAVAQGLMEMSAIALTAVIWVLRKRKDPSLVFAAVEFAIADVEIEDIEDETGPKEPAKPPVKGSAKKRLREVSSETKAG